jgi:hypothetical protein
MSGVIRYSASHEPGAEELINRAVVETLERRGKVYAVTADQLGGGRIAAQFRYPIVRESIQPVETEGATVETIR